MGGSASRVRLRTRGNVRPWLPVLVAMSSGGVDYLFCLWHCGMMTPTSGWRDTDTSRKNSAQLLFSVQQRWDFFFHREVRTAAHPLRARFRRGYRRDTTNRIVFTPWHPAIINKNIDTIHLKTHSFFFNYRNKFCRF